MTGDEQTRFCHSCHLNVYNVSSMTTKEAEQLIIEKEGKLCVKFYRRKDGTILTKDCPKGLQAIRDRYARCVAAVAAFVSLVSYYLINKTPDVTPAPVKCGLQKINTLAEEAKSNALMTEMGDYVGHTAGSPSFAPQGEPVMGRMSKGTYQTSGNKAGK